MSQPIKDLMTNMPYTIGHDAGIQAARNLMSAHNCHHLPVLSGGELVGIISDRDIRTIEKVKAQEALKIEDIMTVGPVIVKPTDDVFQVAMLMHEKKIGSVIVSGDDSEPWGIFTSTDALAYLARK